MLTWMETLLQDTRIAFRLMRRSPALTGIALLSIALSVGAAAVVFTAVKAVLLDPLPYAHPKDLVQIRTDFSGGGQSHGDWVFWNDTQEIIRRTRTLESVGVYRNAVFDLGGGPSTPPQALYGIRATAGLFRTLGVAPMLGRNILPEEDQPGHAEEMILSYGLWTTRFQNDRNIVGRTVRVNGHNCLVIGVMPPGFNFPLRRAATRTPAPYVQFWAPFRTDRPASTSGGLGMVGRLRSGVSLVEAREDLDSISHALAHDFPKTNGDRILRTASIADRAVGNARNALWFLMASAAIFLLIGCANVANLLLARGLLRRREVSVRMAVGAGRARIIRQLLTESCVLAVLGGSAGYLLTTAAWRILPAMAPVSIPRLAAARADWTILLFTIALALVTGMLFGMAPALRSAAAPDFTARGAASGRHDRTRAGLVMGEVAIAVALVLVGAQLLGNFIALLRTGPGFDADRVLASVVLPAPERYQTPAQRAAVYRRFLDAARAIPGVAKAGTVDALPFSGENHGGFISVNRVAGRFIAEIDIVGGDYLQTLGLHLASGRWFREEEMKSSNETAILNDIAAQHLWPGENAIGKQICIDCTLENPKNWKRVVGVVSSVRHADLDAPPGFNVYLSARALETAAFLVVRTDRPVRGFDQTIQRAIASVDPDQPVLLSASMQSLISDTIADRRFVLRLLVVTGCLALLMSIAGIYGVTSYTASRRTQEIGVRMALGATPGNVHALLFRQSFLTVIAGLAAGILIAVASTHALHGIMVGLESQNTKNFWMAACLVGLTAAAACWIPARRAIRIDPVSALRQE